MAVTRIELSEVVLIKKWGDFYRKYFRARFSEVALEYPHRRSVTFDHVELDKADHPLAEELLERPVRALWAAEQAMKEVDFGLEERPEVTLRVERLPAFARIGIRDIRTKNMGALLAVEGLVRKVTEVRPRIQAAVFKCLRCGQVVREPQDEHLTFKEPLECYEGQGGCGRATKFKLLAEASGFVDTQKVEVQESPENLRGGEQPQRLTMFATKDLCGMIAPGDRVVVNGVLQSTIRRIGGHPSTMFDYFVDVVSIEMQKQEFEEVKISPEDEEEIHRLARDPHLYEKLAASMAPSIYGLDHEKLALALQLFGGVGKELPDGSHLRGDIHVLLVGDPGVAKSQILRRAARLAPRGIYTSGKSASAAGLTAAAVKDEFGEGRWTLEAGALVLADRGLACIDEIDKMSEQDTGSMHEAMEQQSISVAKAGLAATLHSRAAILAAGNPKLGRFGTFETIASQIDLDPPLLSRFDLIFALMDKPKAEADERLAMHILRAHRAGEMGAYVKAHPDGLYTEDERRREELAILPPITPDVLRKYVAYAKRNVFPVLTEAAMTMLKDHYVNLRRQAGDGTEQGPIPLTPRQLEAFVRIAEAGARARLSNEVTHEDARRAIELVEYSLRKVASSGEGGLLDVDVIATGMTHAQRTTQRDNIRRVVETMREIEATLPEDRGVSLRDLAERLEPQGVPVDKIREILERLKRDGAIYQPRHAVEEYRHP